MRHRTLATTTSRTATTLAALALVALVALSACADGDADRDKSTTSSSGTSRDNGASTTSGSAPTSEGDRTSTTGGPTATTVDDGAPGLGNPARVRVDGVGRLRWGMTLADAEKATRTELVETPARPAPTPGTPPPAVPSCLTYAVTGGPADVRLLFIDGAFGSVVVTGTSVTTRSGLGVGTSEADILEGTNGRNRIVAHVEDPDPATPAAPHRIVWFPDTDDSDVRVVFETDGVKVTRFWAGVIPAVAYPDGCANAPQPG